MTLQKWAIFIMGVYGGNLWKYLSFVGSSFRFWLYKKRWHTSWKFQFGKKQVIKMVSPKSLWQSYMKWTVNGFIVDLLFLHKTKSPINRSDSYSTYIALYATVFSQQHAPSICIYRWCLQMYHTYWTIKTAGLIWHHSKRRLLMT